jgi:hypothetical protein
MKKPILSIHGPTPTGSEGAAAPLAPGLSATAAAEAIEGHLRRFRLWAARTSLADSGSAIVPLWARLDRRRPPSPGGEG